MVEESSWEALRSRKVLMGTCGWSDHSLLKCGKFYPSSVRTAEDRLQHYSSHFPCVEVDTSTYAIPSIASIKRWISCVPRGFLFHFKAFGLFCSKTCPLGAIPAGIRCKLPVSCQEHLQLSALSTSLQDEIWDAFNNALKHVQQAGVLGVVVFQFHLPFKPTDENKAYVTWCRQHLDPSFSMAVEFRCREWFIGKHRLSTEEWLRDNKLALVAADELEHETFQKNNLLSKHMVLPVAWSITRSDFHYIRLHRREGNQRLLSDQELMIWEERLRNHIPEDFQGPIYFMWGTDWEDQPLINAKNLSQRLGSMALNWKSVTINRSKNSLFSAFKRLDKPEIPSAAAADTGPTLTNSSGRSTQEAEAPQQQKPCSNSSSSSKRSMKTEQVPRSSTRHKATLFSFFEKVEQT